MWQKAARRRSLFYNSPLTGRGLRPSLGLYETSNRRFIVLESLFGSPEVAPIDLSGTTSHGTDTSRYPIRNICGLLSPMAFSRNRLRVGGCGTVVSVFVHWLVATRYRIVVLDARGSRAIKERGRNQKRFTDSTSHSFIPPFLSTGWVSKDRVGFRRPSGSTERKETSHSSSCTFGLFAFGSH